MRRALVLAGCGALITGLSACESTEQESAKIGRENQVAANQAAQSAAKPASKGAAKHRQRAKGSLSR